MYQKLSEKVDKVSYNAAEKMIKSMYLACNNMHAWDPKNSKDYQNCTDQIKNSNSMIHKNFGDIELYSINYNEKVPIQITIEQILEDIDIKPNPIQGLTHFISHIKNVSLTKNQSLNCLDIEGCLKRLREVVIKLKMLEWGLYGRVSTVMMPSSAQFKIRRHLPTDT